MSDTGLHFDFDADYSLENDVALLRPLRASDFDNLVPFSENEPDLWRYSLLPANGPENMQKYLDIALEARNEKTSYPYVVYDKREKKYAGSTRFYDIQPYHRTTQLGYTWYGKDFQGTGLNKNCKLLLLTFAFEKIGFERVEFRADNLNWRSIAAMKSIGCKEEGVLRSNCASPSGRRDSIVLSILKEEWRNGIKDLLLEKTGKASPSKTK